MKSKADLQEEIQEATMLRNLFIVGEVSVVILAFALGAFLGWWGLIPAGLLGSLMLAPITESRLRLGKEIRSLKREMELHETYTYTVTGGLRRDTLEDDGD